MQFRLLALTAFFGVLLTACSGSDNNSAAPAQPEGTATAAAATPSATPAGPVVVYSSRQEYLIKPIFDRFTEETGIEVQLQTGEEGPLIARLQAEGKDTYADIFYTVDAGNLWSAADKGLLTPLNSPTLDANIPANLRDPQGRWFGLSVRARTIVYSTVRVQPSELSTYEALADPKWKGRLCLRTSKKVYNMSLVATLIDRLGEPATENVVKGWVSNLATGPMSSDNLIIQAIAAGQCDVGIVNTYYLGQEQQKDPQIPVALFWANQTESGVHVNVSGAGITTHAKHPEAAKLLLEWLSTNEPQHMFSELNLEFPAVESVTPVALVQSWGDYKPDPINVETAGRLQAAAVMLMDRADY
ncbi:MAG: extracellular solute-binding protein, partial [Pseudomonadota bacterium]